MSFRIEYLLECLRSGIPYIPYTLKLALIVFVVSTVLAFLIATVRFYKIPVISQLFAIFVTLYMGVPNILALNVFSLILVMCFQDIMTALQLPFTLRDVNFIIVAYVAMILSDSVWMSENFRGAYKAIKAVQFEAGYAIGYSEIKTLRRIIVPQIIPIVLPNLMNWLTGTIKGVSLISTIGLVEVMNGCLQPCGRTYSYLEGYVAAALIYWALVVIFEQLGKIVEKRSMRFRRYAR